MKTHKYLYLLIALMACITALGQNTLTIPVLTGGQGKDVMIPIEMDNADEIVAVQFDLTLPFAKSSSQKVELNGSRNVNGHTVSVRSLGNNRYTVVVVNMSNQPLTGNGGQLLAFPMQIPTGLEPGEEFPITLSNVILSNRKGDNIQTGMQNGSYVIQRMPSPDLEVSDVGFGQNVLIPGEKTTITWKVVNIGDDDTHSGWVEKVYLVNRNTEKALHLGNNYVQENLVKGGQSVRRMTFDIPKTVGMEDEVMAKVVVEPNSETGEYKTDRMNNQATGGTAIMQKKLFLSAPAPGMAEGTSMRMMLTRSGDNSLEESFAASSSLPENVSMLSELVFRAGQSVVNFDVRCVQNSIINTYRGATVTVKAANGYAEDVSVSVDIEDDEQVPLAVNVDKTEYVEGDVIRLHVSVPYRVAGEELCLNFNIEKNERFVLPLSYRFEEGATSATIEIPILQDDKPANDEDIELTVSAPHHTAGTAVFILKDDDVPTISMSLHPNIISEDAGYGAIQATIVRNGAMNSKVTLKLSDDGNNTLYYDKTITLNAGVEKITFPVSVKDNQVVDGTRNVKLKAAVYLTDCGCSAIGDKQTSVSEEITIVDNDGPTLDLSLDKSTILEGDPSGAVLTITRNTGVSSPLTVTLDAQGGTLKFAKNVSIPAGSSSVKTSVVAEKNAETGDGFFATITASCKGFNQGTAWLMVSDRTLPDAEMQAPVCDEEVAANSVVRARVALKNIGAAVLPKGCLMRVELGDASTVIQTDADVEIGSVYSALVDIKAPSVPGEYKLSAKIEKSDGEMELQTMNNCAYTDVKVVGLYSYSIVADKDIYTIGEKVMLSGDVKNMDGSVAANAGVEPYVVYAGSRIPIEAATDADGHFAVEYVIPVGMGGDFGYGICMPGEKLYDVSGSFNVYGICRTNTDFVINKVYVNEPYKGKMQVRNLSVLPLHNVRLVCDNAGAYCIISNNIELLAGNATAEVEYTMLSSELSTSEDWDKLKFCITSDEGVSIDVMTYNYTYSRLPNLIVETTNINTTVTKGTARIIPINITNTGMSETGKISVAMPEGLSRLVSLVTPSEMQSLARGDSATLMLRFDAADFDVNIIQKGNIALNCENGHGERVFFNVKVVSEEKGSLVVRVQDENTIYGNRYGERPYVQNATVRLTDYNTGALVVSDVTDEDGCVRMDNLNEGYYHLHVTADRHGSYDQNVLVSPGEQAEHLASINYQAVSVDWVVEETEVEDEYEIVTDMKFETHVPVPVVTMTGPDEINLDEVIPGRTGLMNMVIRNQGLISALDVNYTAPKAPGYVFMPLVETSGFELAPEQSYVIPVLIMCEDDYNNAAFVSKVKRVVPARVGEAPRSSFVCNIGSFVNYKSICGPTSFFAGWEVLAHIVSRLLCPGGGGGGRVPSVKPGDSSKNGPGAPNAPGRFSSDGGSGILDGGGNMGDAFFYLRLLELFCDVADMAYSAKDAYDIITDPRGSIPQKAGDWVAGMLQDGKVRAKKMVSKDDTTLPALLESAYTKFNCYLNYYSAVHSYRVEMTGAPEALAIEGDFYQEFVDALSKVDSVMDGIRTDGELWNFDLQTIPDCSTAMNANDGVGSYLTSLMPNGRANIADFSLRSYVERLRNKWRREEGLEYDSENYPDEARLDSIVNVRQRCVEERRNHGCVTWEDLSNSARKDYMAYLEGQSTNTCATVKLEIKQKMAFTRQAFRGTLTIDNSSGSDLSDICLNVNATNMATGAISTAHEMQITVESIDGFGGDKDGKWTLPEGKTGVATILFIPTKYAAPDTLTVYSFGGSLSFNDGETVQSRSLYPVSLQVKPSPELDLTYFMQRDVYGDNPLTPDVKEPVIPAEFSVLIHNKGNGRVDNLSMLTEKPQIVDNEKGLLSMFDIVSSSLNGGKKSMALEDNIATSFGAIEAGESAYATWNLTCSLMGHFVDYDVSYAHLTDHNNPDLSLLDRVTIHELLHSQNVNVGGKSYRAWITNDVPDAADAPDRIYLSDGTDEELTVLNDKPNIEPLGQNRYRITASSSQRGWFYTSLANPVGKYSKVLSVINEDSGVVLDSSICWTTDYTIQDGFDPLLDYRLHLADYCEEAGMRHYVVEFEPVPELRLMVESIAPIPHGDEILEAPIEALTVTFNKDIDIASFTGDDVILRYEGEVRKCEMAISPAEDGGSKKFLIDTHALDQNGFYTLQINTDKIIDNEGFAGADGKQVSWMLFKDGLVHYNVDVLPAPSCGKIECVMDETEKSRLSNIRYARDVAESGLSGTQSYGQAFNIIAVPNQGFEFKYWKNNDNGQTVATDAVYSVELYDALNLSAVFALKQYVVNVLCDEFEGEASMTAGVFDYGTNIELSAKPNDGYRLVGYRVNGAMVETDEAYALTVNGNTQVEVIFERLDFADSDAGPESPIASIESGTAVYYGTELALSCATEGVNIYYTTDGSNPVIGENAVKYNGKPIKITGNVVLKMIAMDKNGYKSEVAEYSYSVLNTELVLNLSEGWNWFSHCLNASVSLDWLSSAERIMSQTEENYNDEKLGMVGSIKELKPGQAYKVKASTSLSTTVGGSLYDFATTPIEMERGWNWIGYPLDRSVILDDAFRLMNSENGDYITSLEDGFAQFDGETWVGSLTTMMPGKGYMYKSASKKELMYNAFAPHVSNTKVSCVSLLRVAPWTVNIHAYPNIMCITADLFEGKAKAEADKYFIAAFSGDECRGVGQYVKGIIFLSVYGDKNVPLTFMAADSETGEVYAINETCEFNADVLGSVKAPFAFHLGEATDVDEIAADGVKFEGVTNILGQQLRRINAQGFYVIDGKKIFINKKNISDYDK